MRRTSSFLFTYGVTLMATPRMAHLDVIAPNTPNEEFHVGRGTFDDTLRPMITHTSEFAKHDLEHITRLKRALPQTTSSTNGPLITQGKDICLHVSAKQLDGCIAVKIAITPTDFVGDPERSPSTDPAAVITVFGDLHCITAHGDTKLGRSGDIKALCGNNMRSPTEMVTFIENPRHLMEFSKMIANIVNNECRRESVITGPLGDLIDPQYLDNVLPTLVIIAIACRSG